jgi:hypothetical protein
MTELEKYRNPVSMTFAAVPDAVSLAERIAPTEFVPKDLRNRPEAVLAAMLTGAELGLPPMASLAKIHVIEGRPGIAAELMRALVLSAGHELWLEASSNTSVTLGGKRRGSEHPTRVTFTIDDARNASLDRKAVWRNYPRAMLTARATGELCRLIFADVLAGISYTTEELSDGFVLDEDAETIVAADPVIPDRPEDVPAPEPKKTTRKAVLDVDAGKAKTKAPVPAAPAPPLPGEGDVPATKAPVASGDVEVGDVVPGPSGATFTPAQALAIRSREIGLDDDTRRGVYLAVTGGRAHSGNDLSTEEVSTVFAVLEEINEGNAEVSHDAGRWTVSVTEGETVGETVFDSGPAADVPSFIDAETAGEVLEAEATELPLDAENAQEGPEEAPIRANPANEAEWRAFLKALTPKGTIADALRSAAALSGDPKAAPTLKALAENRDLSEKVAAYLAGDR